MHRTLALIGTSLSTFLLTTGCQPQMRRSDIGQNYGDQREQQLWTVEMQNLRAGANPGTQNPAVTGVNPGVGGIERAPTGGSGSVSAGAPVDVNPGTTGITRQLGVGAPSR